MQIAYVDESGDDGTKKGASLSYALGCVVIDSKDWTATFDEMIEFRRWTNSAFGVPVRAEIKANYLLRNGGPLRAKPLRWRARFKLYRAHMRIQDSLHMRSFAVVIDKSKAAAHSGTRPTSDIAWEYLLQRLERSFRDTEVLVVHDEGDAMTIRKRCRKARRAGSAGSAFGTGLLRVPFKNLLDDPVPRDSRQSYFLQLADLNAYAAFRKVYPPSSPIPHAVVPPRMWDFLGGAHFTAVRNTARYPGPRAIVPGP